MSLFAATVVVSAIAVYLGFGLAFAIPFVFWGASRIDPVARESTWGFRLIVLPGVVALWPLLAWRWFLGPQGTPSERNPHRTAAARSRNRPA